MKSTNELGGINVSAEAVATLTGEIVAQCYGVVGMASKKLFKDAFAVLLKKENISKGVVVKDTRDGLILDIYVIVCYGVKIPQVVKEVQKKVKYELGNMLDIEFAAINVYVQGVKEID